MAYNKKTLTDKEIEKFFESCDYSDNEDVIESDADESDADESDVVLSDDSFSKTSSESEEDNVSPFVSRNSGSDIEISNETEEATSSQNLGLRPNSHIITFSKNILRGKNLHKWSTVKPKSHHTACNIVHKARGPTRNCKNIVDPLKCFELFISEEILNEIVQWTNAEINLRHNNSKPATATNRITNEKEIKALLGILVLSAARKDNHLAARELFDSTYSGSRYVATMSKDRFLFLQTRLRFDDKSQRIQRISDKFAPTRNVWDSFIQKCIENYIPGNYVTIDEQLLAFRGRSSFRMYIPNKPAKYGLKIIMMCDSGTKYMVNAIPYLGKDSSRGNIPIGEYYVKELTKSIHGTNRNVTMDNWFTSVPLAKSLFKSPYNLTLVGTLRKNKKEIPKELLNMKGRKCQTSIFCYDQELTLLSYKPKPNKVVCLLSSCNEEGTVNIDNKKPHMIEFYNSTKGGVDTLDQMCSVMSCSRKTNRWPMCIFYGILNIAFINSYVIYTHNMFTAGIKPLNRRQFMKELHKSLVEPWQKERLEMPKLLSKTRANIENIVTPNCSKNNGELTKKDKKQNKRSMCRSCPYQKRRMTKSKCDKCEKPICGEHKVELCDSCSM